MEEMIWIYKTNVSASTDFTALKRLLDNAPGIQTWSIDLEDCDKILRVVAKGMSSDDVVDMLVSCQVQALELPY